MWVRTVLCRGGQIVNILDLAGNQSTVAATQLCLYSKKTAIDSKSTNSMTMLKKTMYKSRQWARCLPMGSSLPTAGIGLQDQVSESAEMKLETSSRLVKHSLAG